MGTIVLYTVIYKPNVWISQNVLLLIIYVFVQQPCKCITALNTGNSYYSFYYNILTNSNIVSLIHRLLLQIQLGNHSVKNFDPFAIYISILNFVFYFQRVVIEVWNKCWASLYVDFVLSRSDRTSPLLLLMTFLGYYVIFTLIGMFCRTNLLQMSSIINLSFSYILY